MSEPGYETETEFLDRALADLSSQLSEETEIHREYAIKPGIRADAVVVDQDKKPIVVVEAKIKTGSRSQDQAIQQIRTYLQATEAKYGLFLSPDIRYLFSIQGENPVLEVSHSDLANILNGDNSRRGFSSYEELAFCYDRARDQARRIASNEATIENIIVELQRIATAERQDISVDPLDDLRRSIEEIDDHIQTKYPFYNFESKKQATLTDFTSETKPLPVFTQAIQGVLRGYSIVNTDSNILREFTQHLTSRSGDQKYSTPLNVAQYLVGLAEISPDERVLDPACGWGNLLREAEREGAEGVGIDIDREALITASGFNSLLDLDIEFYHDNGLQLPFDTFQNSFDHVLLDPPIRSKTKKEDLPDELAEFAGQDIAQSFVIASLEALNQAGTLTAIVPVSLLAGAKNREFRKELLNNSNIRKVVEVAEGSLSPTLGADLAVIQVEKQGKRTEQTEFVILDEFEDNRLSRDPDILNISTIDLEGENILGDYTLLPSEVLRIDKITEEISQSYPEIGPLDSVVNLQEISKGVRVQEDDLSLEGSLPYFKISNATGEKSESQYTDGYEDYPTAGTSDLLIGATGTISITHVPERRLIPDQNWAVAKFDSHEAAVTYDGFFKTDLGRELLIAVATGQSIPYTPLYRFRQLPVPLFDDSQISSISSRLETIDYDSPKVDESTTEKITDIFIEEVGE